MDTKDVGDMLKRALPPVDESLDTLLNSVDTPKPFDPNELFSPTVVLLLPKAYYNRKGKRVDVYGMIDVGTKEFHEGFRYYDHAMSLLKYDGRRYNEDDSNDVVSRLLEEDLKFTDKPQSDVKWVHPRHWVLTSFFLSRTSSKFCVEQGGYFLNRMGFVVDLTIDLSDPALLVDTTGTFYNSDGSCYKGQTSCFDLQYQIINWNLFSTSDWSEEMVTKPFDGSNYNPARFNPLEEDRQEKLSLFFDHTLQANKLAKELGISFGFHFDSGVEPI